MVGNRGNMFLTKTAENVLLFMSNMLASVVMGRSLPRMHTRTHKRNVNNASHVTPNLPKDN